MNVEERLAEVAKALEQERAADALAAILAVWREKRATEIADAVDAIASAFPPGPLEGADPHAAWLELAREGGPEDVGTLLQSLVSAGSASTLIGRVEKLIEREPDPRVARCR